MFNEEDYYKPRIKVPISGLDRHICETHMQLCKWAGHIFFTKEYAKRMYDIFFELFFWKQILPEYITDLKNYVNFMEKIVAIRGIKECIEEVEHLKLVVKIVEGAVKDDY